MPPPVRASGHLASAGWPRAILRRRGRTVKERAKEGRDRAPARGPLAALVGRQTSRSQPGQVGWSPAPLGHTRPPHASYEQPA